MNTKPEPESPVKLKLVFIPKAVQTLQNLTSASVDVINSAHSAHEIVSYSIREASDPSIVRLTRFVRRVSEHSVTSLRRNVINCALHQPVRSREF